MVVVVVVDWVDEDPVVEQKVDAVVAVIEVDVVEVVVVVGDEGAEDAFEVVVVSAFVVIYSIHNREDLIYSYLKNHRI